MQINTGKVGNLSFDNENKKTRKAPNINYLRDKDRELVKGVFNFHESKGGILRFAFRKYKGDPIEQYELEDGKVYTIPRGVAKHLNTSGRYTQHQFALGPDGQKQRINKQMARYGFQSLEFTDFDDYQEAEKKIVTAEEIK